MIDAAAVCVYCRVRPVNPQWRPFCGERCKVLDLARWADGSYRVAADPLKQPEDPGNAGTTDNSDDQGQT